MRGSGIDARILQCFSVPLPAHQACGSGDAYRPYWGALENLRSVWAAADEDGIQSACRPRAARAGAGGKGFSCGTNGHAIDGIKRSTTLCRPQCAKKTLSKCCRLRRRPPSGLRDLGTRARRGRFDERGPIQSLEKSGLCGEESSPLSRRRFWGRCRCSRARPFCAAIGRRARKKEALLKQQRCPRLKVGKWPMH